MSKQTYEEVSDFCCNYDLRFGLDEMARALKYMVDKFERVSLIAREKTKVKTVKAKSQAHDSKGGHTLKCPYCSGSHKATECTKYKIPNA